jgi:hypothetical protein
VTEGKPSGGELFAARPAPAEIRELAPEDDLLLARLTEAVWDCKSAADVAEPRMSKVQPDLVFRLRARFGSYPQALAVLVKREIGDRPTRKALLARLKEMYGTGVPLSLDEVVRTDGRFAHEVLLEFGGLDTAFAELGVNASAATRDRRWEREDLFKRGLDFLTSPDGGLNEATVTAADPVFLEALRHAFGSFHAFQREFNGWLNNEKSVALSYGRGQLGRVLLSFLPETSRAARGRRFPDVTKLQQCTPVMPGQRMFAVGPQGLLYPVDGDAVPLLFPSEELELPSYRVAGMKRGARVVSVVAWGEDQGFLALATRKGRVKLIDLSVIRRVLSAGVIVARLEPGDAVVAASVLKPDFERLLVLTVNGRGVALEKSVFRTGSRKSRGALKVRFEEGDEPVAVVGVREQDDVLLLGVNGVILRIRSSDVTTRKGPSFGRLVSRAHITSAATCVEGCTVVVGTRRARLAMFPESEIPRRQLRRRGVAGIRLDADDAPEALACF